MERSAQPVFAAHRLNRLPGAHAGTVGAAMSGPFSLLRGGSTRGEAVTGDFGKLTTQLIGLARFFLEGGQGTERGTRG